MRQIRLFRQIMEEIDHTRKIYKLRGVHSNSNNQTWSQLWTYLTWNATQPIHSSIINILLQTKINFSCLMKLSKIILKDRAKTPKTLPILQSNNTSRIPRQWLAHNNRHHNHPSSIRIRNIWTKCLWEAFCTSHRMPTRRPPSPLSPIMGIWSQKCSSTRLLKRCRMLRGEVVQCIIASLWIVEVIIIRCCKVSKLLELLS